MSLLALTYTICLVFACHNFVKHIVIGKRLRNWLLTTFYLIVMLICVFRILSITLFGTLFLGIYHNVNQRVYWSDQTDTIATYLKAILGVQQMASMIELYLLIKRDIEQLVEHRGNEALVSFKQTYVRMRVFTVCMGLIIFAVGVYMFFFINVDDFCNG